MTDEVYIKRLESRGVKATALRLLIFKTMLAQKQAFSLTSLEDDLETIDKSTISRAINLFHNNHLIHSIDDGTGSVKYSVCYTGCAYKHVDSHVHFHCNKCDRTFCLTNVSIPEVCLPEGFIVGDMNFVIKGVCDACSNSAT